MSAYVNSAVDYAQRTAKKFVVDVKSGDPKALQYLETAATVGMVAAGIVFGLHPTLVTFFLAGIFGFVCHDVGRMARNYNSLKTQGQQYASELFDISKEPFVNSLTEGAPLARIVLKLYSNLQK